MSKRKRSNLDDDDDDDVIELDGLDIMLKRGVTKIDDDVMDLVSPEAVENERNAFAKDQRKAFEKDGLFSRSDVLLGTLSCLCVGVQYYKGEVQNGEFVNLVREPSNPYDANAIRVDNLSGEKVGHIERLRAASIKSVMDGQNMIKVEGVVDDDEDNAYKKQLKLSFYGRVQDEPFLRRTIGPLLKQTGTRFDMVVSCSMADCGRSFQGSAKTTTTTTTTTSNGNDDVQDLTWAPSQMHWSQKDGDWAFGETYVKSGEYLNLCQSNHKN